MRTGRQELEECEGNTIQVLLSADNIYMFNPLATLAELW